MARMFVDFKKFYHAFFRMHLALILSKFLFHMYLVFNICYSLTFQEGMGQG